MPLSRRDLVNATAAGAAALVDPRRLPPRWRRGYRIGTTVLTAGGAWFVTGQADEKKGEEPMPVAGRAALSAALAGLTLGTVSAAGRMDAGATDWLARRGVKRPRVVLAVGVTALSLAMAVLEGREEEPKLVEVTPDPARQPDDA